MWKIVEMALHLILEFTTHCSKRRYLSKNLQVWSTLMTLPYSRGFRIDEGICERHTIVKVLCEKQSLIHGYKV